MGKKRSSGSYRRLLSALFAASLAIAIIPAYPVQATSSGSTPYSREPGTPLQFTSAGYVLCFNSDSVIVAAQDHLIRTSFTGSNTVSPIAGDKGNSTLFSRVTYPDLWDGITLVYHSSPGSILESTYYLHEATTVNSIRLTYNRPLSIDGRGNLIISCEKGSMAESAPVAWQETGGKIIPVQAAFVLFSKYEAGFILENYMPGIPVVIDPSLTWNTFLGPDSTSSKISESKAIAVDSSGNSYITGYTSATWGSPVRAFTPGHTVSDRDAFIAKLDSSGNLIWHTFLGGSGNDAGYGIAISGGSVYITGLSSETWEMPVRDYAALDDAFVARLNSATGVLTWNTFLGGSNSDAGKSIAVDNDGFACVAGYSNGAWDVPFRSYTANYDGFTARLNSSGDLLWHTFLGGDGDDYCNAITTDSSGNIYVAGYSSATWESPVRQYTANFDAFAARLNNSGDLIWNTFLGGDQNDTGNGIAGDGNGNIYVAGNSFSSWGSPIRNYSAAGDAYAARINCGTGVLSWNTFLGGSGNDEGNGITADSWCNVYVTGLSGISWGSPWRAFSAIRDAFAARLNCDGVLTWNTFLGGAGSDFGNGIALDNGKSIFIAGYSAYSWGSPRRALVGENSGFVAQIYDETRNVPATSGTVTTNLGPVNFNITAGGLTGMVNIMPADIRCSAPSGYIFPYGMFSFNIIGLSAGQQVTVTVKFPNPLPIGTKYYKCQDGNLIDCSPFVTRINEYTLQLNLTDGGQGDADGIRNGAIVDPGGPAFPLNNILQSSSSSIPTTPQKPVSLSNISVKSASLSATKVAPGEHITVTANIANTGTSNGASVIKVYVNGSEDATQGVSVNSGSTSTVTFDVIRNEPGTYTVYVGGIQAGSFTVDQFTPNTILFISGALVFFALVMGMIYMTRRRA